VSRYRARYQDPEGRRHNGFPTYGWQCAPSHLVTRRQLAKLGLRPGGSPVVAQMLWYCGRKQPAVAYLYDTTRCKPKRPMTEGRRRTIDAMIRVRSTCRRCLTVAEYCLPQKLGRLCLDCLEVEGLL
jgi:hypothetical protein